MTDSPFALTGAAIFDGEKRHDGAALIISRGRISAICPAGDIPRDVARLELGGGVLAPGFVDLQVNGGGGVMFNDDQSVTALRQICDAHARFGSTALLPTLITDTPERTRAAIAAVRAAVASGVPGVAGLHLEGPHLSQARKGAHDLGLIRPMTDGDLDVLLEAAATLPALMVTVAVENVTNEQIARLSSAGVVVSLGHTDASYDQAVAAVSAGARCVTHLFNAMSQMGNREPGVVGAALDRGELSAGLIADGFHAHPAAMRAALRAKRGPGEIFLVTDAMSTVGTALTEFTLNGRRILRRDGRLTLADGTLAGADLDMAAAVAFAADRLELGQERALAMAGAIPARVMGFADRGKFCTGARADIVHLSDDLRPLAVWRVGEILQG